MEKKKLKIHYGSYAKGIYNGGSDLDIAIFSESFEEKKLLEMNTFLFSLARRYKEICIDPVGFSNLDMIDNNPFVKEILETGKKYLHIKN